MGKLYEDYFNYTIRALELEEKISSEIYALIENDDTILFEIENIVFYNKGANIENKINIFFTEEFVPFSVIERINDYLDNTPLIKSIDDSLVLSYVY